jgi:hypothetical protein
METLQGFDDFGSNPLNPFQVLGPGLKNPLRAAEGLGKTLKKDAPHSGSHGEREPVVKSFRFHGKKTQ